MKRTTLLLAFLFAAVVPAAAQTSTRERRTADATPTGEQPAIRTRVVGDIRNANHASKEPPIASPTPAPATRKQDEAKPAWGNTSVPVNNPSKVQSSPARNTTARLEPQTGNSAQPKLVKQTSFPIDNAPAPAILRTPAPLGAAVATVYRVGVGDVLDIRLANVKTRESTLFTVMKTGVVEYPLLARPMVVSGLTTEEIARRLTAEIKVIRGARAIVSVRDYASHAVVVTGMVDNPGRKVLRREAMPLFAVLTEALARSEATTATVVRAGKEINLSLSNSQDMATLVMPGDTIRISAAPKQFVYLAGDVTSGGEKEFREGMTLTQAVFAAGGAVHAKSKIKISRRNTSGFLVTDEHNLSAISEGKSADPLLQPGDLIEVRRAVW